MRALLLATITFVVVAKPGFACSCGPSTAKQNLEWSDAVFTGKVISVRYVDPKEGSPNQFEPRVIVTFSVTAYWKGDARKTIQLHTYRERSSCSGWFDFAVGTEYLVYASKSKADVWLGHKPVTIADVDLGKRPLATGPDLPAAQSDILGTSICSRTGELSALKRVTDLRVLGKPMVPDK